MAVSVSVSPVLIVTLEASWQENPNVPAELADQKETSVSVSPLVPAQLVQAGWLLALMLPADGLPQVTAWRVVTLDTFAVPFAPGAPVCSWTSFALVPVMFDSAAFATVADRPSAMEGHLLGAGQDPFAWLAARTARERARFRAGAELRAAACA